MFANYRLLSLSLAVAFAALGFTACGSKPSSSSTSDVTPNASSCSCTAQYQMECWAVSKGIVKARTYFFRDEIDGAGTASGKGSTASGCREDMNRQIREYHQKNLAVYESCARELNIRGHYSSYWIYELRPRLSNVASNGCQ